MIEYLPAEPQSFPAAQVHDGGTGAKNIKQNKLRREKYPRSASNVVFGRNAPRRIELSRLSCASPGVGVRWTGRRISHHMTRPAEVLRSFHER
jgi:hypothetical protein